MLFVRIRGWCGKDRNKRPSSLSALSACPTSEKPADGGATASGNWAVRRSISRDPRSSGSGAARRPCDADPRRARGSAHRSSSSGLHPRIGWWSRLHSGRAHLLTSADASSNLPTARSVIARRIDGTRGGPSATRFTADSPRSVGVRRVPSSPRPGHAPLPVLAVRSRRAEWRRRRLTGNQSSPRIV